MIVEGTRTHGESRDEDKEWPWTWYSGQRPWLTRKGRQLTGNDEPEGRGGVLGERRI